MEESFFLKLLFNMRWLPGKWMEMVYVSKIRKEKEKSKKMKESN